MRKITILLFVCLLSFVAPDTLGICQSVAATNDQMTAPVDDAAFDAMFAQEESEEEVSDPLESVNRVFFVVNDSLYFWVVKPVNRLYSAVLPQDIRQCVGNFFDNVAAPVRVINNLLQGKLAGTGVETTRFLLNSTVGVLGLGDPALTSFDLRPSPEDFGQTLGVWGVGEGAYLYLPIIGPSSLRDAVGFVGNTLAHPATYVCDSYLEAGGYYSAEKTNLLSLNPDLYEDMKRYSLDPYISMRQVYLEYRRNKVADHEAQDNVMEKMR